MTEAGDFMLDRPGYSVRKLRGLDMTRFLAATAIVLSAVSARAQTAPSLVVEPEHAISVSRGAPAMSFRITSSILKQTRRIYLVLPVSFSHSAADRRYPVTIVLDGEVNVPPVAAVSDELSRNGQIPESVIVALPNVEGSTFEESARNRVHDLTPPGLSVSGSGLDEGGDRFLDFIEKELLPAVDRQFRGTEPRTFIGHSNGGILATYVAATRPAFRAVIAIDTPTEFGDNWLPKKLLARASSSMTPLRYVSYEARRGWRDNTWQSLMAAAPATWKLHREHLAGESHESIGMLAMYLGLREVFSDYSMLAAPVAPTTSILPYYGKVSEAFGGALVPPRKLLRNVIDDLLDEGRGSAARAAYNTFVSGYGRPPDAALLEARIAEVERRPPPKETVEAFLATAFPSPEEARGFLGEWVGGEWMTPDEPRDNNQTLRIRVVEGRVVGETIYQLAAGEQLVQPWQYIKITPAGMTWGYMNGMRPRGLLLFEGALRDDTLSGQGRFGGIDFRRPDGSKPPPTHFIFKRVRK